LAEMSRYLILSQQILIMMYTKFLRRDLIRLVMTMTH